MSYYTWANINVVFRENDEQYVSREDYLRLERVEVGKICKCGNCICCLELEKHSKQ